MAIPKYRSRLARLLEPGQMFYEKGSVAKKIANSGTYTVVRVEPDRLGIMFKVFVEGRSKPFTFNDTDRVQILADPPGPTCAGSAGEFFNSPGKHRKKK